MIRTILRALLNEQPAAEAPIAREERSKLSALTLEKAYTALASDLAVMRADLHELAKEMREYERRAEQVYSWLARLRTDLYEALGPEAQKAFRKRDQLRDALNPDNGTHASAPLPVQGPTSPLDV